MITLPVSNLLITISLLFSFLLLRVGRASPCFVRTSLLLGLTAGLLDRAGIVGAPRGPSHLPIVVTVAVAAATPVLLEQAHGCARGAAHLVLVLLEEGRAAHHRVCCQKAEERVERDSRTRRHDLVRGCAENGQLRSVRLERVDGGDTHRGEERVGSSNNHGEHRREEAGTPAVSHAD